MRNTIIAFAISALSLGFLASCSDNIVDQLESVTDESGRTVTIHANLGDESTKVSLAQYDSSLDMLARWDDDDVIKTFLDWNGKLIELPVTKVHDISEDRKGCLFSYTLPDGYDIPDGGYRIICFTMAPGTDAITKPVERGKEITWGYALRRCPIDQFRASLYYEGTFNESNAAFTFTHLPTYEILHFYNVSNKECKFALNGFSNDDAFWYAMHAHTKVSALPYIGPGSGAGGGGGRSWGPPDDGHGSDFEDNWSGRGDSQVLPGSIVPIPDTRANETDPFASPAMTVPAGYEAVIVSSYIPTGRKIVGARMVAEIDGKIVESENTKSSDVELETGKAYHMYASWDGFRLQFEDGTVAKRISLEESSITIEIGTNNRAVYLSGSSDGYSVTSSNESVATAFASGNILYVSGIGAGECDITVSGNAGQQPAVLHVTVKGGDAPGEAVDLGLPSGIKWASCNVGATKPEEYGEYFAWGETEPKQDYSWSTYKWCNSSSRTLTKYCLDPSYGTVDNKLLLDQNDDVAHVTFGDKWRMPTYDEYQELVDNCDAEWVSINGVEGAKITSKKNGNSIFFPAAGCRIGTSVSGLGSIGAYSSMRLDPNRSDFESFMSFGIIDYDDWGIDARCNGLSVRPVFGDLIMATSVSLNRTSLLISTGGKEQLTANLSPANCSQKELLWSSSDPSVATVSSSGLVVGISSGSATITVSWSGGGNIKATCSVEVDGDSIAEAVDLGLPSGIKWASCNLGASKPEEYGGFYQWGGLQDVTDTSIYLDWNNCPYHTVSGSSSGWTKYVPSNMSSFWSGTGSPDNKTVLDPEDDVAHVTLGGSWRMPTRAEFQELTDNCTSESTILNGVIGRKFTSKKNGNSIFLPAAGYRSGGSLYNVGSNGRYWSSSLDTSDPNNASSLYFHSDFVYTYDYYRCLGRSVRPVYDDGTGGQAEISVSTEEVKFGAVYLGESATSSFTITNTGTAAASVSVSEPSDPVSSDVNGDITISAGSSRTVTLTFSPKEKGSYGGRILVSCGGTNINVLYEGTCIEKNNDIPEAVDLGLSVKWASCNLGASKPEGYGDYYAWGETQTKSVYSWTTYKWCNGSDYGLTKYNANSSYGSVDNKATLEPDDDVAHAKLGGNWRMPTEAEFEELINNCTSKWTTLNGVKGRKFTSNKNGNSIFLPAAGFRDSGSLDRVGSYGGYWSSSLSTDDPGSACYLNFDSGDVRTYSYGSRCGGRSVRPVSE